MRRSSRNAVDSTVDAGPCRRTGFHFAGTCFSVISIVVLAVSVSACATFETGETRLQRVKTVGIISAVGDQMTFAKAGLTGLDNRIQRYPIETWGPAHRQALRDLAMGLSAVPSRTRRRSGSADTKANISRMT